MHNVEKIKKITKIKKQLIKFLKEKM